MAFKAGFIGLVGLPNAGKSSFLNFLLNEHLCIVSRKPQATRRRVHGVVTTENYQIVFVDSPGFLDKGRNPLTDYIATEARRIIDDVDALVLLIPADLDSKREITKLVAAIEASGKPYMFCMSKADLTKSKVVEELLFNLSSSGALGFPLSIKKTSREKVREMLDKMAEILPEAPGPFYDEELYTTENTRDVAAELIREQCFELLEKEIPFGLGVNILSFKEEKKITRIEATILVEKENHKGIVIGKKGTMLKQIGESARKEIEKMIGQKVYLGLHVSHKADWTKKKAMMKELGYDHGN